VDLYIHSPIRLHSALLVKHRNNFTFTFIPPEFIDLTNKLHGAEPFLRNRQLRSHSRISQVLWNPKVHYRVHKSPPLFPILNQINPVHTTPRAFTLVSCSGYFLDIENGGDMLLRNARRWYCSRNYNYVI
jgi:hypothetical protein